MSITKLRPLWTKHNGYSFRSRTEARWAVFFDELGLKYSYESEGFDLGDGVYYLPDFKLTTPQGEIMWVEVKGDHVTSDPKFEKFQEELREDEWSVGVRTRLVSGDPYSYLGVRDGYIYPKVNVCPRCGMLDVDGSIDGFMCWACDGETPSGGENPEEVGVRGISYQPHKGMVFTPQPEKWASIVTRAATVARMARFGT